MDCTWTICLLVVTLFSAVACNKRASQEVCYPHVGCFNKDPPFDDHLVQLPKSPEAINTTFLLFTRKGQERNESSFIDYTDIETLRSSNFNPALKVKFVTHGFFNNIKTPWPYYIKDELLKKGDFNVITVAWGPGALFPYYTQAVGNTRLLARQVEMVINMTVAMGTRYEDIHLIGHSLGAHTSGQVGQNMRRRNITIGRITGMDPAQPNYIHHPKSMRLDKMDAAFVDVIHTNGIDFYKGGAGLYTPCGDVDFYVNGGLEQPDCASKSLASIVLGLFGGKHTDLSEVGDAASCSHSRSHQVFAESINSDCPFTAYPCSDYVKFQNGDCLSCGPEGCGVLGYYSDWYPARGQFFLNTRMSKPYCGHHYAMKARVSGQSARTQGSLKIQLNGTWGVSEWVGITRHDNDTIMAGQHINSVVVTSGIVGIMRSANVKYTSIHGGAGNIDVDQISILSGESGLKYLACLTSPLVSGVTQTYAVSQQESCS